MTGPTYLRGQYADLDALLAAYASGDVDRVEALRSGVLARAEHDVDFGWQLLLLFDAAELPEHLQFFGIVDHLEAVRRSRATGPRWVFGDEDEDA